MNIEGLQQIVRVLKELPDEKFNICHWKSGCGTMGYAIGWACQDEYFISRGFILDWSPHLYTPDTFELTPCFRYREGCTAIQQFLDIDEETVVHLFYPSGYRKIGETYMPAKQEVINRIEQVMNNYILCNKEEFVSDLASATS